MPPHDTRLSNNPKTGMNDNNLMKMLLFTTLLGINLLIRHAIIIKF
jgi:hypothetical protein